MTDIQVGYDFDPEGVYVFRNVKDDEGKTKTLRYDGKRKWAHEPTMRYIPQATQPTENFEEFDYEFSEVYHNLVEKLKRFVWILDGRYYPVLVLNAMASFFREAFYHVPYVDLFANELECGKTTAGMVFVMMSYYGFVSAGSTSAVVNRRVGQTGGVVLLDSVDDLLGGRNRDTMYKAILDAGHTRGLPVERCKPKSFELETFDPFQIKAFTRVRPIPPSILSRSILIPMMKAPEDMPTFTMPLYGHVDKTFEEERNALYRLRLTDMDTVIETAKHIQSGLANRPKDLLIPALTVASLVGGTVYDDLLEWAIDYEKERRSSYEDQFNKTLVKVLIHHIHKNEVSTTEILREWVAQLRLTGLLGETQSAPKRVASRLDGLGLKRTQTKTRNELWFAVDKPTLASWIRRYEFEEYMSDNNLGTLEELEITLTSYGEESEGGD
jgi:hypothetical protein